MFGFVAAAAMWLLTVAYAGGRGLWETLAVAVAFGVFSVLVATGQMLVIASGPGNIDLSVPSVMTLAAYLSMGVMGGQDRLLPLGAAVALGVGLLAGILNYLAILAFRLPPLIATLAWSFVFQSLAMDLGGEATIKPPPLLAGFAVARVAGVQVLAVAVLLVTLAVAVTLGRTVFGRSLLAVGQNEKAAALAGVDVRRVRLASYAASGAFAAAAGFLLAGFTGGAALSMGEAYLMESVAVVVLGGTSVTGGQANAVGIWGAALFFNLLAVMLNTFHVEAGVRLILTGLIIVAVVAVAVRPARA
jgi:ribose transport system permease protein